MNGSTNYHICIQKKDYTEYLQKIFTLEAFAFWK